MTPKELFQRSAPNSARRAKIAGRRKGHVFAALSCTRTEHNRSRRTNWCASPRGDDATDRNRAEGTLRCAIDRGPVQMKGSERRYTVGAGLISADDERRQGVMRRLAA